MTELEDVSVVIPTYRRADTLRHTLAAIASQDYPADRYEVLVVDDGPDPATKAVVAEFEGGPARITYLPQPNAGVAAARNHGARAATGDILIFLDDDIVVEPSHIRDHLSARAGRGDCLVNGHWEFSPETMAALAATPFGRFRIWVEDWVKQGVGMEPLDGTRVAPSGVTACNLSIAADSFWRLEGFDEAFPYAGCEDQDFSHRAKAAGHQLVYDHSIRLLHNDRRLDLRSFCERQRRGAFTAVVLAVRHPAERNRSLIRENTPPSRQDGPRLLVKKALKSILGRRRATEVVHAGISLLERVAPNSSLLRRAYWSTTGIYINRGVREGLTRVGGAIQ